MITTGWKLFKLSLSFSFCVRRWYLLSIFIVLSIGVGLRLSFLIEAGTDAHYFGGLWVGFIDAMREGSYALPESIRYITASGTPYAYPPLSFYTALALSDISGLEPLFFVNVLPGMISIASLGAFYWLSMKITSEKLLRVILVASFAFLSNAYFEQHVPAGLAEAFGTLTLIILAGCMLNLRDSDSKLNVFIGGVAAALAILASPGSAVATFITISVAAITQTSLRSKLLRAAVAYSFVTGLAITFSSWFWLSVIWRHGVDIFLVTFADRAGDGHFLIDFARNYVGNVAKFDVGELNIVAGIALLGIVALVRLKQLFVPIWLFALLLVPQESSWLISGAAAIATGYGIYELRNTFSAVFAKRLPRIMTVGVVVGSMLLLLIAPIERLVDSDIHPLSSDELELAQAAGSLSAEHDLFLIVSSDHLATDNFLEWFPFLTNRTVLNQRWGAEFITRQRELDAINDELQACSVISCVTQTALLLEGPDESSRYIVVHTGIQLDSSEHLPIFENEAGVVVQLR